MVNNNEPDDLTIFEILSAVWGKKYLFIIMISFFAISGMVHGHKVRISGSVLKNTPATAQIFLGKRAFLYNGVPSINYIENYTWFPKFLRNIKGVDEAEGDPNRPYIISISYRGDDYFKSYSELTKLLESIKIKHQKIFDENMVKMKKYKTIKEAEIDNLINNMPFSSLSVELKNDLLKAKEDLMILNAIFDKVKPTIILMDRNISEEEIEDINYMLQLKYFLVYFITGLFVSVFTILLLVQRQKTML